MKTIKSYLILGLVLLVSTAAFAQDQTGSIFGTVKTEAGAAIVGCKVTASSPVLIRPITVTTNDRGSYVFPSLPVGTYSLQFEAEQYQGIKMDDIAISLGSQLRINPTLKAGVVGEEIVTITGEAPMIDVKSTDTGMSISKELFNVLPKGRNYETIVSLAPGASDEDDVGGGIMIDGSSSSENEWFIDGVNTTNFVDGTPTTDVNFDFIEEVQVRSGGYEAEFGGSMGGVINVVTRSGGNEFHGQGTFYYNSDWLDADWTPTLRKRYAGGLHYAQEDDVEDEYNRYEFGFGLGGYLMKDTLWFFGSFMPVFEDSTRFGRYLNAAEEVTGTEQFERTETTYQAAIKLTAQVSDNIRMSGSFVQDYYKWEGRHDAAMLSGSANPDWPYEDESQEFPAYSSAFSADVMLTDNAYFNFKGGYHYNNPNTTGYTPDEPRRAHWGGSILEYADDPAYASVPAQYRVPNNFVNYAYDAGFKRVKDIREKMNWSGDLTYFVEAGGNHQLKAGVQFFRIAHDIDNTYPYDYVAFYWGYTTAGLTGKYGYFQNRSHHPSGYGTVADVASNRYALFAQDSWSVGDQFTINVGVRAETERVPSYSDLPEYQYPPIEFDYGDKIAPRIGAAYDMFADGTLKIYGNYAQYYDVMRMELPEGSFGGFKWITAYYPLDTLEWWTIGGPGGGDAAQRRSNNLGLDPWYSRNFREPSHENVDPDLAPGKTQEFIFGADYQLTDEIAVSTRFVYKDLIRTLEDIGTFTPTGEIYLMGNPGFGLSAQTEGVGDLPTPTAKREYKAVEVRIMKRYADNWTGGINLTISELWGNYSGLASSDEFGRHSPNVNRYFDVWYLSYDENWNEAVGKLATDRPLQANIFGAYTFDEGMFNGLTVGFTQYAASGTPMSTDVDMDYLDGWYPYGRGDMGRSDFITQTDIYAEYNFNIGEYKAQVNLNVQNLFDQHAVTAQFNQLNNSTIYSDAYYGDNAQFGTWAASGTPLPWQSYWDGTQDPRYGQDWLYQNERTIRLGFKFIF